MEARGIGRKGITRNTNIRVLNFTVSGIFLAWCWALLPFTHCPFRHRLFWMFQECICWGAWASFDLLGVDCWEVPFSTARLGIYCFDCSKSVCQCGWTILWHIACNHIVQMNLHNIYVFESLWVDCKAIWTAVAIGSSFLHRHNKFNSLFVCLYLVHWYEPICMFDYYLFRQRTEIYEYSKTLGNSQFVLLPFQPYKYVYALMLAEVGRTSEALKYITCT